MQYSVLLEGAAPDAGYRFKLGSCYYYLEDWEGAVSAWDEVIRTDPSHGPAHRGMAAAYWRLSDYDAAWRSVGECQRLGVAVPPDLISRLQEDSGRLGPN